MTLTYVSVVCLCVCVVQVLTSYRRGVGGGGGRRGDSAADDLASVDIATSSLVGARMWQHDVRRASRCQVHASSSRGVAILVDAGVPVGHPFHFDLERIHRLVYYSISRRGTVSGAVAWGLEDSVGCPSPDGHSGDLLASARAGAASRGMRGTCGV